MSKIYVKALSSVPVYTIVFIKDLDKTVDSILHKCV